MNASFICKTLIFLSISSFSLHAFAVNRTVTEDGVSTHTNWEYSGGPEWQFHSLTSPSNGTAYRLSAEDISYKPNANYCGSDRYTYKVKKYVNSGGGGGGGFLQSFSGASQSQDNTESTESQASETTPKLSPPIIEDDIETPPKKEIGQTNGYYQYQTVTVNMTVTCVNDTPTITNISIRQRGR